MMNDRLTLGLEEFRAYCQQHGTTRFPCRYVTPGGYRLGKWAYRVHWKYRDGHLPPALAEELTALGFSWESPSIHLSACSFQKGIEETLKYRERHGTCNAPQRYVTPNGYCLGAWQSNIKSFFKRGKLSPAKLERLREIGVAFDRGSAFYDNPRFERGIEETLCYAQKHSGTRVPYEYKTPDGFWLGVWQGAQRRKFRDGSLKPHCVARLKAIGFDFSNLSYGELFKRGLTESLSLYPKQGDCNVQRLYRTSNGFKLGVWQAALRYRYQQGTLSKERIRRLESIGFVWNLLEHFFSRGYEATVQYKAMNGCANCPSKYVMPDGYHLGSWQSNLKTKHRKRILTRKRIALLNRLDFDWGKVRGSKC